MTGFSADHTPPPARFRPSTGQIGQAAALKTLRPPGKSATKKPSASSGPSSKATGSALPSLPEQVQAPDYRHIEAYMHWQNAKALGRDLPFGVWLLHNGYGGDLLQPGQQPFDWFSDVAHG